jgi:DNA-binding NtrC family response regulator
MKAKAVLLVEDQNGFIAQAILESYGGMRVTLVTRGDEAIQKLDSETFDGVILDLRLPVVSGFVVLEAIKRRDPNTPVVVLSAFGDKISRERAARLGADGYIEKPPNYPKLHDKLSGLMALRQAQEAANRRFDTLTLTGDHSEKIAKMRRLQRLKEQAAKMGIASPPEILNEIDDLEAEIDAWR